MRNQLRPLFDRVVIKELDPDRVRRSGLIVPPASDELKALYEGAGVTPDKDVIAYCRIGERSAHTWFVLTELLGYGDVENYDGSWTEYGSLVGVPVER